MTSHFISQPFWLGWLCQLLIHCLSVSNLPFSAWSKTTNTILVSVSPFTAGTTVGFLRRRMKERVSVFAPDVCPEWLSQHHVPMAVSTFTYHVLQVSHPLWRSDPLSGSAQWLRLICAPEGHFLFPWRMWTYLPSTTQWTLPDSELQPGVPDWQDQYTRLDPDGDGCQHRSLEPPEEKWVTTSAFELGLDSKVFIKSEMLYISCFYLQRN